MINIKELKKHKKLYKKLSLKKKITEITVMFDYCSSGIWRTKKGTYKLSKEIQNDLKQWIYDTMCLYLSYDKQEEKETEYFIKEDIKLDERGLKIAKKIKKELNIKVIYYNKDHIEIEV